jgi:uncharacterized protein YndB with AHSA1/START domain
MSETIEQTVKIAATPEKVWAALTDGKTFSAMTGGAPAELTGKAGDPFSCFGGMILGRNVECVTSKRLVQAWRAKTWDEGVYSIVRFELENDGAGTNVRLEHAGFPEGQAEHLGKGWHANYWEPMKKMLG